MSSDCRRANRPAAAFSGQNFRHSPSKVSRERKTFAIKMASSVGLVRLGRFPGDIRLTSSDNATPIRYSNSVLYIHKLGVTTKFRDSSADFFFAMLPTRCDCKLSCGKIPNDRITPVGRLFLLAVLFTLLTTSKHWMGHRESSPSLAFLKERFLAFIIR